MAECVGCGSTATRFKMSNKAEAQCQRTEPQTEAAAHAMNLTECRSWTSAEFCEVEWAWSKRGNGRPAALERSKNPALVTARLINLVRSAAGRIDSLQSLERRSRKAFPTTDTELTLIAALAMIGLSSRPKNG
jgi:hypothetical protein